MDISGSGSAILYGAFGLSIWSSISSTLGYRRRDPRLIASGRRALYSTLILLAVATALLLLALLLRDFSLLYVVNYTSRSTPLAYALTSLWAGMEGSLLFWTLISAAYASTAIAFQRRRRAELVPMAAAVQSLVIAFFTGMLSFAANPFDPISPIPFDGSGLNPLLQSPFMTIHPVLLYLGLTGFLVPFSFAVASLFRGRLDFRWFTSTRRWTIVAWSFLTVGIILGAAWAYTELGWGGYWAWDPVENASLLPWLVATAFLHSVMIQERRAMLKVWNVALIVSTYCLAIFGTFLTRSGLLSSVHTFSESPVGPLFLPFLGVLVVGAYGLLGWRLDRLRADRGLDSMLSREAMFLFNNLLFVSIAFTVLWGTLYPVLVEALRDSKISVGPPFFNAVITPIGLALLALTGIGPLVAWRRASIDSLKRTLAAPMLSGSTAILLLAVAGVQSWAALFAFGLCAFVLTATLGEFYRGARAYRNMEGRSWLGGLRRVIGKNRRRYGGYIIHLGVVLIFVGFAGSAFKQTWTGSLRPGEEFRIGAYTVNYVEPVRSRTDEKMVIMAVLRIDRGGEQVARMTPQRNFHIAQQQPQSEVGIRSTPVEDLYVVLTQMDEVGVATIRAWVNPLVMWIWIGGAVMIAGMIVILSAKSQDLTPRTPTATRAKEMVAV